MAKTLLRPKSWASFQHYKDRSPPWIRLHKSLLDDYDFQSLQVASRALAPMLWLIASNETSGVFDAEPERLAFRLRLPIEEIRSALKPLIDKGFFEIVEDASGLLASCVHGATTETETETLQRQSTETEREKSRKGGKRPTTSAISQALADGVEQSHLDDWIKARKSPLTMTAWEGVKTEAQKAGISPAEAVRICAVKGWRGFDSTWNWRSASHSGQLSNSDQRDAEAMKLLGFGQGDFIDA